jgi:hypothetical protein
MRHERRTRVWLVALPAALILMTASAATAQFNKKNSPTPVKQPPAKPAAPAPPRASLLTTEAWQKAPLTALKPGELDELVSKELQETKVEPAPRTTDEQFIRRVYLDVTGELPSPADVEEFVANKDSHKRTKLIDKVLNSEEYAKHWARYWRDVFLAATTNPQNRVLIPSFESWLTEEFAKNRSWGEMAREIITAEGEIKFDDPSKNGQLFMLVSHRGVDTPSELAAETSRIFMGIQIQCAQCHDHPSDQWKRVQFHELAAYFARVRGGQPIRTAMTPPTGFRLAVAPRGEHEMPSKEDPKKTFETYPVFLDGKAAGKNLGDHERRQALANSIVGKDNYWFAGAYVNRIWGELMGQSFYQPVDDMGPKKEAVFPTVLTRLTGAFRGNNYNMKAMFRAILNSDTYQRQIRLGESADQHLHFAAAYPTRLRPDALWESLVTVLGSLGPTPPPGAMRPMGMGPYARAGGLEVLFKEEFNFDPSMKSDEVEGSIPQALLMMNNPQINQRIQARGSNVLGRILTSYPKDDEALRMVYLKTLARKPTDSEHEKALKYVAKVGNRQEAFEDLLWALLNSTEFQTKR